MSQVRFGIISSAWIAGKEVDAINRSKLARIVAVSSRSMEKLEDFIKRNGIDRSTVKAFTSYEDLISCEDVEVVYVPIPTTLRLEIVKKAAKAGKHIIVEKPFVSSAEVREMIEVCKQNSVCIMENTMFVHHNRTKEIESKYLSTDNERYNRKNLKRVNNVFNYTNRFTGGIRYSPKLEPDGCLGDLGWYCIHGILWGFNELPIEVMAMHNNYEETGAMTSCQALLRFQDNKYASFTCSFDETTHQVMEFIFSDDLIVSIPDFVLPLHSDIAILQNKEAEEKNDEDLKIEYSEVASYMVRNIKSGVFEQRDCEACFQVVKLIDHYSNVVRNTKEGGFDYGMIERSFQCMKVIEAVKRSLETQKMEKLM